MAGGISVEAIYSDYLAAFNNEDLEALERFLAPELVFDWGNAMPPLVGWDAFNSFYTTAWSHFREHVVASSLRIDGLRLTAWIDNHVSVFRDWPDCPIEPMCAGDVLEVDGWMAYDFDDDGRITRISDLTLPPTKQELS